MPQIVNFAISRFTLKGERVLSNFMGRGTDAIECLMLKRRFPTLIRCVGVDINPAAIKLAQRNTANAMVKDWKISANHRPFIVLGDSRYLEGALFEDESFDHVLSHPPYQNSVKYSRDVVSDISRIADVDDFLGEMDKIILQSWRVLKYDRFYSLSRRVTLMIGDNRSKRYLLPNSFLMIRRYINAGFELEELIIKKQRFCRGGSTGTFLSQKYDFLLMEHEFIATLRKVEGGIKFPATQEIMDPSMNQFIISSWKINKFDETFHGTILSVADDDFSTIEKIAHRFGKIASNYLRVYLQPSFVQKVLCIDI